MLTSRPDMGIHKARAKVALADWLVVLEQLRPALIAGIGPAGMAAILSEARILHLRRPKEVLRQDEVAEWGYLILRGRIEVTYLDINGNRVLAHLAGPGEALGEVEQFSGRTCAASCTTLPDTTLLQFDAAMILRHVPGGLLLANFAGIFHDRLTRDNRQHSAAMFYTAEDRIRMHLLEMTSPDMPQVRFSQTDLAGFAGCSRQTVNKTLSQLRADGIVEMQRGMIRVLDRVRLQDARNGTEHIRLEDGFSRPADSNPGAGHMSKA